jgi:ATP-binding cassette subfamily B protein
MLLVDDVLVPLQATQRRWDAQAMPLVLTYLGALLASAILSWLFTWGRNHLLTTASEYVAADVRNTCFAHLQRLSLEYFGGKRTGDLISRISSDSDRICNFLSGQLLDFAIDVITIAMTAVILFTIHPLLAVVTLLPFPLIAWLSQLVRTHLRHGYALAGRAWSDLVSVLADTIPGIRVVKAFAQESQEIQRFGHANQHAVEANMRVMRVWSLYTPVITLLTTAGELVIWAFGAWLILGGTLKLGVLFAFVQYMNRFYGRLDSMSRMLAATERTASSTHRIFEILDRTPSVAEPVKPVHPGRVKGRIELKGVRFAYGPREVIKGIDLTVEPGEMIGLVGPSGAGKSTLVNLVCRFFDVASGAIFVDGHDIRSFPIEEYRRNIGIVLQDPFLFYGTIAENIAYGRPSATRGEIIEAAKAAKAHEFILRLTDGYDSLVGERGQSLSGGERQRISIARALLPDPRILILDEATSSVDTETEREIQGALDNLTRGRTTIAIAHRLSTLRNANRIVVMERGQITEVGGHDELLQRAGTYARLHAVQQVDPKAEF